MESVYLPRDIDDVLLNWKNSSARKPLLLRGARQVGKSSSVRELARHFDFFLEINFEEQKEVHHLPEVFLRKIAGTSPDCRGISSRICP